MVIYAAEARGAGLETLQAAQLRVELSFRQRAALRFPLRHGGAAAAAGGAAKPTYTHRALAPGAAFQV